MCLFPKRIKTRSKYISFTELSRLAYDVPCGKCSDCQSRRHSDYLLRSYVEQETTKQAGGFTYFDTLTYATQPTFNGIPCFNKHDVRNFLKRLHITLMRKGYQVTRLRPDGRSFDNLLHHFISCEYGETRNRCHYHVIFFSRVPNLKPYDLWNLVRLTWKHGFNNAPWEWQKGIVTDNRAIKYVAKYVIKDSNFTKKFEDDFNKYSILLENLKNAGYTDDDKCVQNVLSVLDVYNDIDKYKSIYPFTLQSNGFGEHITQVFDYEKLVSDGFVTIVDGLKSIKCALPLYNQRKLFYTKYLNYNTPDPDTFEPLLQYRLHDEGIRAITLRYQNIKHRFIDNFLSQIQHIKQLLSPSAYEHFKYSLSYHLSGVNLQKYADYHLVYKGCLYNKDLQPLSALVSQKQTFLDRNQCYINPKGEVCYFDENGNHRLTYEELYNLTYDKVDKDFEIYDRLASFIGRYHRTFEKRKNDRFFKDQQLNYKIKNAT